MDVREKEIQDELHEQHAKEMMRREAEITEQLQGEMALLREAHEAQVQPLRQRMEQMRCVG